MGTSRSDERSRFGWIVPTEGRGQTTLDFAIGISIFLAVLLFIFLFIPGILSPFTASAQEETVASNRVADQLATGTLASPTQPYVLDNHCTVRFFQDNPGDCPFSSGSLESVVGVEENRQRANVTIRGNLSTAGDGDDILCWDGDGDDTGLVEASNTAECDTTLTRGDSPSSNSASVTSLRVVSLDGTDVTIYVEMW